MVELPRPELAVSVFAVLAIDDEEEHARHFHYRDEDSDQRPESRYLERFDDIRRLQELIVARARREGVPVIENDDADSAARQVADLVLDAAERIRTVAR
jgi:2-phosphoglycerate kinase